MDNLTANPIQAITLRTGKAAIVLLVLTLSVTPINTLFGFRQVIKVRRALGLYAFLYAGLHFAIFIGLDYVFDLELIIEAIFDKPFALVGFLTGLILIPLAITSTKGWMKRLISITEMYLQPIRKIPERNWHLPVRRKLPEMNPVISNRLFR
jgi:sulfoxide reductase heme-binding subunit YedZ